MPDGEGSASPKGNARELTLATVSFAICFYAWALLGPLGPDLQEQLDLTDSQLALTISIPVVLGSLMRIPLGVLTDRYGGRKVFTLLMAYTPLPLIGLALFNDSWAAVLVFALPAGVRGRFVRGGRAVRQQVVPATSQGFALGVYGVGMGGTVVAALTAPGIATRPASTSPFWIAAAIVAVMSTVFWSWPRTRRAPFRAGPDRCSPRSRPFAARGSGRAWALTLFYFMAFGGFVAMFLYLPKLLVDVHDLTKTGCRSPSSRIRPACSRRTPDRRLALRSGRCRTVLADVVRGHRRARTGPRRFLRGHGAADDFLPDNGGLPRPRNRCRLQARARMVPGARRRSNRRCRCSRRARWLLSSAGDGPGEVPDRELHARLRADGRGGGNLTVRAQGRGQGNRTFGFRTG